MKKFVGLVIGVGAIFLVGCCCYQEIEAEASRVLTGYELMEIIQSQVPGLSPGPCGGLLVTKNEFHVFSLRATIQLVEEVRYEITLPECRYDAVITLLGRLKERDAFVSVGLMMTQGSPAWGLVFLASDNSGIIRLYFLDPYQVSRVRELSLIIPEPVRIELIIF